MKLKLFLSESKYIDAVHRTTINNADSIKKNGFSLDNFGQGAGLGFAEEPSGIFFSLPDNEDFYNEIKRRKLKDINTYIYAKIPADKIWEPTRDERINKFHEVEIAFLKDKYKLNDEQAIALRRGMVKYIKDNNLTDAFKDYVSNKTEIELKDAFRKYLIKQGYTTVKYRDAAQGVDQILVLDPKKIKIVK
jgi:hypothetical protein